MWFCFKPSPLLLPLATTFPFLSVPRLFSPFASLGLWSPSLSFSLPSHSLPVRFSSFPAVTPFFPLLSPRLRSLIAVAPLPTPLPPPPPLRWLLCVLEDCVYVLPATCLSCSRALVSAVVAAAWVLVLLLAPLAVGGFGAGRRVLCWTLSSVFCWTSGGIRSPLHTHANKQKYQIRQPDVRSGIIKVAYSKQFMVDKSCRNSGKIRSWLISNISGTCTLMHLQSYTKYGQTQNSRGSDNLNFFQSCY